MAIPALVYVSRDARAKRKRQTSEGADDERAVVAAEAETVGDGAADAHLAGGVGDVIEVAIRVGRLVVNGRVDDAGAQRLDAGDQLDAAAGAEQVAGHAL